MRRRDLLIGSLPFGLLVVSRGAAISATPPLIGFLNSASEKPFEHLVAGFRKGLAEAGFVENVNVRITYRWAEGHYERLPALAKDLMQRDVAVLVATGGEPAAHAAKAATSRIPIVFAIGGDPLRGGLVSNLGRPDANVTGITQFTEQLEGKRLALLLELVPRAMRIAALVNPNSPIVDSQTADVLGAAERVGRTAILISARDEAEFEDAISQAGRQNAEALIVCSDPYFNSRRGRLIPLVTTVGLPAIYEFREFALAGGLMSYGANLVTGYRHVGNYAGRILNGATPAELPVLQPTAFDLLINLKAARALRLDVPASLLARADEVIE